MEDHEASASTSGNNEALMANVSFGDAARDNLRTIVGVVDQEITRLPAGDGNQATDELRASWTTLVKLLALGPVPETRECPACHGTGMRSATRCAHCWAKLELPAAAITQVPRSIV
jgi:hypothetical protein